MKKFFAILLAVAMFASMATFVSAAENTTTLRTTVPSATYTLNIPANQEIKYGATLTDIGEMSVTGAQGFAVGKNLLVTLAYSDFACSNTTTKIPFKIHVAPKEHIKNEYPFLDDPLYIVESGSAVIFKGEADGTVRTHASATNGNPMSNIAINITSENWGKALAGEYTATITFTAEVVANQ